MNINITPIKGKWLYKSVKIIFLAIIAVIILASLLIILFNEKIIAFINAF